MFAFSLKNISFKISAGLVQTYLFTDELLPQELTRLKHVRDVVERTETFVFVFVLLLNRKDGERRGGYREENVIHNAISKAYNLTHPPQMRTFWGEGAVQTDLHTVVLSVPAPHHRHPVTGRIWN